MDELVGLNSTASDWSNWDDTYAFVQDANEQYIGDNLDTSVLINLRLNLMLFVDTSGRVVFGKAVDLVTEQEMPPPPSLLAQLSPDNLLLRHPDLKSSISGIILLPEDPILVVSQPILTNAGTGPSRGTLIIGRYLDASEIQYLAELTHLSLHLNRFDDPKVQTARTTLSAEVPIFIQPLDTQTVVGYGLLTDIYGQPALIIQVDMPREIYQQGQASVSYLMGSLVAVGLIFGAIILLLLEQQVLSRLTRLSQRVSEIGVSGDLSARVPTTSEDELSHLARAINTMLGSLEQSEHALREQTRRNELILQTSLDGFMVWDINGQLREVNPAFCRILGYPQKGLLGMHLSDLQVQENIAGTTTQSHFEAILKTGADRFETKYRHQDGHLIDVEVSLNFVEFGQDRFFFGFLRDISERKHIEAALAKEHNLLRTLIDNLPDSIYVKDTAGRHLLVNHAAAKGAAIATREEMLGKTDLDLYPPEVARQRYADDLAVIQSGQPLLNQEEVSFDQHGRTTWDLTTKVPLRDSNGKVVGLIGITRDITVRKRTEAALRTGEERYRSLFENLPIAVMEQDFSVIKTYIEKLQGQGVNDFRAYFGSHPDAVTNCAQRVKLLNMNKASLELYEARSKEELTRGLPQIFNQKSYEVFKDLLIAIVQGKTRVEQETINRTLKGTQKNLALSWSVVPGYEETFSKVLVSLVDVTEHKRLKE
ncbi:MAG: PAS domain S-box protein [Anaerolineales bacterium]|nr:PAS domain S-box protein [Anaerolineales bacterium]